MTMKDDLRKLAEKFHAETREKLLNTCIRIAKSDIISAASVGETSTTCNIDMLRNDYDKFCDAFLAGIKDDLPDIEVSVSSNDDGVRTYTFSWNY